MDDHTVFMEISPIAARSEAHGRSGDPAPRVQKLYRRFRTAASMPGLVARMSEAKSGRAAPHIAALMRATCPSAIAGGLFRQHGIVLAEVRRRAPDRRALAVECQRQADQRHVERAVLLQDAE